MRRLLLLLVILILTGCSARTTVDISMANNGTGTIAVEAVLDAQAAAAVPDLAKQLSIDDLRKAGWTLSGPETSSDGSVTFALKHHFGSPAEANTLMTNLTGPSGAFQDFHLSQQRSLSSVKSQFSGTIDLSKGISGFGDDSLAKQFGGPLGFDTNELQKNLGVDLQKQFQVAVKVSLPGNTLVNSTPPVDKDGAWHFDYGTTTKLQTSATAAIILPGVYMGISLGFLLIAVMILVLWRLNRYRPKHRKTGVRARDLLEQAKK